MSDKQTCKHCIRSRGRPKKRWMDYVKEDIVRMGISVELIGDRREWKRKVIALTLNSFGKRVIR